MCVICVCNKESPDLATIKSMAKANADGIGISWIQDGIVHWKKGITEEQAFIISKNVKTPFIMHFRIGTIGGNSKHLAHPFPLNNIASCALEGMSKQGVLFHNGHWTDWRDKCWGIVTKGMKLPKGHWSDSRAIAWLVAIYGRQILSLIEGQKIALLTPKGAEIYGAGWEEKNGMHFSNLNFETTAVKVYAGYNTDDEDDWRGQYGGWKDGHEWDYVLKKWVTKEEEEKLVADRIAKYRRKKEEKTTEVVNGKAEEIIESKDEEIIDLSTDEQIKQFEKDMELDFADKKQLKEIKNAH